ncbi:uncharacterized protein EI90DRAFT_3157239 [Cantharellus anzutake]|uniref:uncharacterized protein n=1 Tax=Cantharellus anzutake TaxID=1750568 RepID=UPI00190620A9|nr:uncharacterized protein EI90DRAFT_3157239 [Cantharellus anzutake]KAF8324675.1 hypothetical protein EI90DRAFT_3157239 [Cantharellus anzutake]
MSKTSASGPKTERRSRSGAPSKKIKSDVIISDEDADMEQAISRIVKNRAEWAHHRYRPTTLPVELRDLQKAEVKAKAADAAEGHIIGIFQYQLRTNPYNFTFGSFNTRPLNKKATESIAQDLIQKGIKATTAEFMIPVLIKRSFVQIPTKGLVTKFTHRSVPEYPSLSLTDEGTKVAAAGMISILNGRHRWEAMKLAFQICNDEIPRLEAELATLKKQLESDRDNGRLKQLRNECRDDLERRKTYLDVHDDKWVVIVYDQETIEKDAAEGSLVVHSLSRNMDTTTVEESVSDRLQYWAQSIVDLQYTDEETSPSYCQHWSAAKREPEKGSRLPQPPSTMWMEKDPKYVHLMQDQEIQDMCRVMVCGGEHFRQKKASFSVSALSRVSKTYGGWISKLMVADMERLRLIFSPSRADSNKEAIAYEAINTRREQMMKLMETNEVPYSREVRQVIASYKEQQRGSVAFFMAVTIYEMPLGNWTLIDDEFLTRAAKIHQRWFDKAETFMTVTEEYETAYIGYYKDLMVLFEKLVVPQVRSGAVQGLDEGHCELVMNRARLLYGGLDDYYVPVTTNVMAEWYDEALQPHTKALHEIHSWLDGVSPYIVSPKKHPFHDGAVGVMHALNIDPLLRISKKTLRDLAWTIYTRFRPHFNSAASELLYALSFQPSIDKDVALFIDASQKRFLHIMDDGSEKLVAKSKPSKKAPSDDDIDNDDQHLAVGPSNPSTSKARSRTRSRQHADNSESAKKRTPIDEQSLSLNEPIPGFLGQAPFNLTWKDEKELSDKLIKYVNVAGAYNKGGDPNEALRLRLQKGSTIPSFILVTGWAYEPTISNKNVGRNSRSLRVAAYLASTISASYRPELLKETAWSFFRRDLRNLLGDALRYTKHPFVFIDGLEEILPATFTTIDSYVAAAPNVSRTFLLTGHRDRSAITTIFKQIVALPFLHSDRSDPNSPINNGVLTTLEHLNGQLHLSSLASRLHVAGYQGTLYKSDVVPLDEGQVLGGLDGWSGHPKHLKVLSTHRDFKKDPVKFPDWILKEDSVDDAVKNEITKRLKQQAQGAQVPPFSMKGKRRAEPSSVSPKTTRSSKKSRLDKENQEDNEDDLMFENPHTVDDDPEDASHIEESTPHSEDSHELVPETPIHRLQRHRHRDESDSPPYVPPTQISRGHVGKRLEDDEDEGEGRDDEDEEEVNDDKDDEGRDESGIDKNEESDEQQVDEPSSEKEVESSPPISPPQPSRPPTRQTRMMVKLKEAGGSKPSVGVSSNATLGAKAQPSKGKMATKVFDPASAM